MNKKMFTQYQHVMTFKLERSHTGNAVKDLVEYIRRKNISTRNRKSVVYTSFNMYPRKEDRDIMYFESYDFEPHEIPNNLILSSTMSLPYDDEKEYVEITLDDLTDENILKYSKQISGRRQMPTVEVCIEENGTLNLDILFYYELPQVKYGNVSELMKRYEK